MCAVSAITDYYFNTWPNRFPEAPVQSFPDDIKKDLLDIIKRLDQIDKRLNDIECSDPSKETLIQALTNG
jgi:hypothetical protein